MSATYSSGSSLDLGSASSGNAICLSISSGRKRYSFDGRERIKKRRKQLNPVRLSIEPVVDDETAPSGLAHLVAQNDENSHVATGADHQHITYPRRRCDLSSTFLLSNSEPSPSSVNETDSDAAAAAPHLEPTCDSVPLNLTKNRVSPQSEIKAEPTTLFSPHKEEPLSRHAKSESPTAVDKKDLSPPFSPRAPAVAAAAVMRNLFTNTRATCRIFNPEAFCNICNKEFCNKYFLKTHKANKHGVYCETKESSISIGGDLELPVPLMFTWNVNKNNNLKMPSSTAGGGSSGGGGGGNPYLFANAGVKDSSAFCNVCEKEFCNKYFLRRHKEKMHGIVVPFSENSRRSDQGGSEKSEDDERPPTQEEGKFTHELNSRLLEKKYARLAAAAAAATANPSADAVSDFIKICLSGKMLKEERQEGEVVAGTDLHNNISHQQPEEKLGTGEFGVQAKDEDFSGASNKSPSTEECCSCEFCKKSFSTQAVLRVHQKYVHAFNVDDDPDGDGELRHLESVYLMILKFSWLNTSVTYCEICHTDLEKNDMLEMHLMNKHGSLVDELSRIIEDAGVNGLSAPSLSVGDGSILCQICSKTFTTNAAFQQHVYEKCSYPDMASAESGAAGGGGEVADSKSPTRNFCQICKKELCNKYFMKTHMRRMHGIAIQNGVRIGGVTCEICHKELCSKYFLRVHKKNCHGIMESSSFVRLLVENEKQQPALAAAAAATTPAAENCSHSCAICGRLFKSVKWLKTHLFNDHGKLGAAVWQEVILTSSSSPSSLHTNGASTDMPNETNEMLTPTPPTPPPPPPPPRSHHEEEKLTSPPQLYQCSKCQFHAPTVDVLLAHQRLHIKPADLLHYRCMYCFVVTKDKLSLEEHIAYHHLGSGDFHEANEFPTRYHATNDSPGSLDTKNHFYSISNTS